MTRIQTEVSTRTQSSSTLASEHYFIGTMSPGSGIADRIHALLDDVWNDSSAPIAEKCQTVLETFTMVVGEGAQLDESTLATFDSVLGSLERLVWISESGLESHPFEALFLTGSLSYGRFFSVDRSNSDIDLLLVYEDSGISHCLSNLPEPFKNSLDSDLVGHLERVESEHSPDVFVVHLKKPQLPIDVSITAIAAEAFHRVMLPEEADTISAWRDTPTPTGPRMLRDVAGRTVEVPFSSVAVQRGSLLVVPGCSTNEGLLVPSGYQNLVMPRLDYIGSLSEEARDVVVRLSASLERAVEGAQALGHPASLTDSHVRASRMPSRVKQYAKEFLSRGPLRL